MYCLQCIHLQIHLQCIIAKNLKRKASVTVAQGAADQGTIAQALIASQQGQSKALKFQ